MDETSPQTPGAAEDDDPLPEPCPRWASEQEWETWLRSLTFAQQIRRGELDPPEHVYSEADEALAQQRRLLREVRDGTSDPFHYAAGRTGPWPRVDTLEARVMSNTWVSDLSAGWTQAGFPVRGTRPVSHRELIEQRVPRRVKTLARREEWLAQQIAEREGQMRIELRLVLAERHGRLRGGDATETRIAMAWNHVAAGRASLRALRELAKEAAWERRQSEEQLDLF
ncbi:MAG: hypothetical protein ACQGVC_01715 [Myxococcota bacterium]